MVGKIDRNSALFVANNLMEKIKEYCEDYEIVGSIRRKKEKVHDIDIVVKVKDRSGFKRKFKMLTWIDPELKGFKIKKAGPKLISGVYMNVPVDIYITTEENYEGTKLIRTGSAEFNRMLCSIALKKGWKLKADGTGLLNEKGEVIARTEREILEKLLGRYVPPEEREVDYGKV